MKLAAGQKFGAWTLVGGEPIGKGGNGVVWKSQNAAGIEAAMKFLHAHHFERPSHRLDRFRHEYQFLRAESGRIGILPLLDANMPAVPSGADRPWLVTPLAMAFLDLQLSGPGNLVSLVKRIHTISVTLASLHAERKFHRDLKPDNLLELDGSPVVGDFGLIDWPGKEAVTTETELMGPLFYMAPEMMTNAADVSGGPADVYALAKTLWVLATGHNLPLQGQMRADEPSVRLSSYCRHLRAGILDLLLERCTANAAAERPTMKAFAAELNAWQNVSADAPIILSTEALAAEFRDVFHNSNRASERRQILLEEAESILAQFHSTLERVAYEVSGMTQAPCGVDIVTREPPYFPFFEKFGGPSVLKRWTEMAHIKVGDRQPVIFETVVQTEALSNDSIRLCAGHFVRRETDSGGFRLDESEPWQFIRVATRSSALLENSIQLCATELLENLASTMRIFAEQVRKAQE